MTRSIWRSVAIAATLAMVAALGVASPATANEPEAIGWQTVVGASGNTRYFGAAPGADGAVVFGGWFRAPGETDTDVVVRKLDRDGNQEWRTVFGPDGTADYARAVDVGPDGSVFVTGQTRGDIGGRQGGTDFDTFVAKLSPAGVVQWTAQYGSNGVNNEDAGLAIAAADDGSVFVGSYDAANDAAVVTRFSANGAQLFQFTYGEPGDIISDMAMGGDGSAYFSGTGDGDAFLISASTSGTMSSSTRIPGLTKLRVAASPSGDIVAGGDGYLARFGSFGLARWTQTGLTFSIADVSVESDESIVALLTASELRGFSEAGDLEPWSKPAGPPNDQLVVATTDGGVQISAIDVSFNAIRLIRYTGSSTAGGGGSGGGGGGIAGFTDVPAGVFFAEPVAWLKNEGITQGTSPTTFSPNGLVTRAQMAAFLYRLVGEPTGSPDSGFTDVPDGAFYADAVDWLKAEGVTQGTSATTYSPGANVTRAQMAAFLYRLAGSPTGSPDHGFADVPAGAFYDEAVNWLKDQGITQGTSATTYSPGANVTRAQMAAFLFRMATDSDWVRPS